MNVCDENVQMPVSQYVSLSLSLIGLCSLAGVGVAVGSGVGMMAMQAAEEEERMKGNVSAASVLERKN